MVITDLAQTLTAVERQRNFPNVRPKDAATLILVDRSGPEPKVLLGKRHHRHAFMPGKFVFPGGRVDPADRLMPVARPLDPHAQDYLMRHMIRPNAVKAQALALAAIRETFEETGFLLGTRADRPLQTPAGTWADFAKAGYYPDLSRLHFIARAITPSRRPRRFDTRFFAVDAGAIVHKVENVVHADAEFVELVWLPVSQAQSLDMPTITRVALKELEARFAAGFGHDAPVPFYRMPRNQFLRSLL
jgi:8-oxo-dGTP pyrophosphatase MutT (NUDIX family)